MPGAKGKTKEKNTAIQKFNKLLDTNSIYQVDSKFDIHIHKLKDKDSFTMNYNSKSLQFLIRGAAFALEHFAALALDNGISEESIRKIFINGMNNDIERIIKLHGESVAESKKKGGE